MNCTREEAQQMILGLQNIADRLGGVLEVMKASDKHLTNFLESQQSLTNTIDQFRTVFVPPNKSTEL